MDIKAIKKEINNAKNQYDVTDAVDKFDDSCNMDLGTGIYSESDMEDNIDSMDDYHEPSEIEDPSKYSKDQLDLWKFDAKILNRLADDNYPKGFDLYFHEDGTPADLDEMKDIAKNMLEENY